MKVASGNCAWCVRNGKREAFARVTSSLDEASWGWSVYRDFKATDAPPLVDRVVKVGKAKTWAGAYRMSMRAAERLLAKETP